MSGKKSHVFVKLLTGKTVTIPVQESTTIEEIKQHICEKEHIPVASQRLIYQAQQLENERTVGSYKIQNDSTLHLVLRLVAGTQNSTTTTVNTAKPSANKPQETKRPLPPPPVFASALNLPQPQLLFNLPTAANANIKLEQPTTAFNPFLAQQFLQIQQQQKLLQKDTKGASNVPQTSPSSTTASPSSVTSTTTSPSSFIKKEQTAGKEPARKKSKRTKRGQYTKRACTNCRLAHSACDEGRPCKRCITLGKEDSCRDAERKRTRKRTLGEMDYKYYPSMADLMPLLAGAPLPDSGMDHDDSSEEDDYYDEEDEELIDEPAAATTTKMTSNVNDPQHTEIKKEKKPIASPQLNSNPLMLFNSSIEERSAGGSLLDDEPQSVPSDDTALIGGNAVVPYLQANEYTENSSVPQLDVQALLMNHGFGEASASTFPFAQLSSMANNNEQLLQQLMIAYAKQAQELKELKELVRHLQSMIISVTPPTPTNTSLVSRHV